MSVKIGSARIDEHGQAHGGTAGDQTGKEVSTQSWYAHTKGWVLLRAKSAEAREKIARCMQAACDNKHVGYDQYSRESLYNEANGNIKARTTTPGIVPGSLLSFGVIILFANNNIVCHRLPNNPAFTRLFLERIKLFWIELFSAIRSRIVHHQISTHLLTVLTK